MRTTGQELTIVQVVRVEGAVDHQARVIRGGADQAETTGGLVDEHIHTLARVSGISRLERIRQAVHPDGRKGSVEKVGRRKSGSRIGHHITGEGDFLILVAGASGLIDWHLH